MVVENNLDILDAVLKETNEDRPEIESLARLIHRMGTKASVKFPAENVAVPRQVKKTGSDSKKKSTHYISEDIFEDLNVARNKIDELVHPRLKSRISKSRIVDQAIKMILKDFEKKGEKSQLIKEILKDVHQK